MSDVVNSDEIDVSDNTVISDNGNDFQEETDLQVEVAVESLSGVEELSPESWEVLDSNERLNTLQNVENQMAEIQERPALEVISQDLPDTVFGGYNGQNICINGNHLEGSQPVDEMFDTIVHEGRHAYQDYAIENPGVVNDNSITNAWAENRGNYLSAELYGQEIYQSQPLENDAWTYAEDIKNGVYANRE